MQKIAILGAGGFGTALAKHFSDKGQQVILWSAVKRELEDIQEHHENTKLLPAIPLNLDLIHLTENLNDINEAFVVIFAVASPWVGSIAMESASHIKKDALVVNVAKGFEENSFKRLSEIIQAAVPGNPVIALSGPSHAEEIARRIPTTIVAASENLKAAQQIQEIFSSPYFRVYVNDDVIGVEYGGALKNIIALCAGICDGLELGDNTKAALMTRGIAEIARLGIAAGAKRETFAGLSGIGDLIVTCTSMYSRNRRAGILIGQGKSAQEAIKEIGMTVEGYIAARVGVKLAQKYDVSMPITEQLYQVLYHGADTNQAIENLMGRPARKEADLLMMDLQ